MKPETILHNVTTTPRPNKWRNLFMVMAFCTILEIAVGVALYRWLA
jgi:hypothetical protein